MNSFIGKKDFELDKPIVELDLPQVHGPFRPIRYQIERQAPAELSHEAKTKESLRHTQ